MPHIYSIQALRAFAAVLVAFYHVNGLTAFPEKYPVAPPFLFNSNILEKFGCLGVDLFFVVSGFVMTYITWNGPRGYSAIRPFMERRFMRIVPAYWFYTLFLSAYFTWDGKFVLPSEIFYSLTFIPYTAREGMLAPILAVGWTLSYEIYFYILVALGMFFPRRTFSIGLGIYFAVSITSQPWLASSPLIIGWIKNSVVLEFYLGMLICLAWFRYGQISKIVGWGALVVSLGMLMVWNWLDISLLQWRGFILGVPAAGCVLWFLSREGQTSFAAGKIWQRLGASSYSIYLTHMLALVLFGKIFVKLGISQLLPADAFILIVGVLSIALGHALYFIIERPLHYMVTSIRTHTTVQT